MCINHHYRELALQTIERANISAPDYRTARRLLDLAGEDGALHVGYITIHEIIGSSSQGTMRRQLCNLKRAGIIDYHCNGQVEVEFLDYPPRVQRAQMITPRADVITARASDPTQSTDFEQPSSPPRAYSDHSRAWDDHSRAWRDHEVPQNGSAHNKDHACAHTVGWLVGINTNNPSLVDLPTNQPQPETDENLNTPAIDIPAAPLTTGALDPAEQAWSYSLLTAVHMRPSNAKRLAASYPFLRIRDAVAHWHSNRKAVGGKFDDAPGIVVSWFDNPDTFTAPPTSPEWLRSELGQRYATASELAALRQQPIAISPYVIPEMAHVIRF